MSRDGTPTNRLANVEARISGDSRNLDTIGFSLDGQDSSNHSRVAVDVYLHIIES
jgi:hypothetical protein